MEFCSKYGLDYGASGSDEEFINDRDERTNQQVKKRVRKADSNIIAVKFDRLTIGQHQMDIGRRRKQCSDCDAIAMGDKNVTRSESGKLVKWTCEFCYEENSISEEELLPSECSEDVTFLLEKGPKNDNKKEDASTPGVESNKSSSSSNNAVGYLTFCIDNSGSMDSRIVAQRADMDGFNTMNMTRLDGVKAACVESLDKLIKDEPGTQVAVVTFSNDVKYYGDCRVNKAVFDTSDRQASNPSSIFNPTNYFRSSRPSSQSGDQHSLINNKEKIIEAGKKQDGNLKPVEKSYEWLEQRVKSLRTEGSTA